MAPLRLTHPGLDFWIDARLREFDGRWLAVTDLADEPLSVGVEDRRRGIPGDVTLWV